MGMVTLTIYLVQFQLFYRNIESKENFCTYVEGGYSEYATLTP